MTYYILLDSDSIEDIWDENILGEESFEKFYVGSGYKALTNMINREPEVLESIAIIDEKKNPYSVEEFLELLTNWKIILDN
ncbi:MAG: hypothetical protein CBD58_01180 [bacterium TMED198]|nr:MAG: hypothetical protein CBD58_01180 [bacterium TMED198]|tara:strand:+ start:1477 stop:1719 length:243 start_codon:yes stop_codon:yes gene_type:complete